MGDPRNSINKWYQFDDLLNQGNLVPINNLSKELLTEFGAYILYVEEN